MDFGGPLAENNVSDKSTFPPPNMPKPPSMINGASPVDMDKE